MIEEKKYSVEKMLDSLRVIMSYYDYESVEYEALVEGIVQIRMNQERKREMEMIERYAQESLDLD